MGYIIFMAFLVFIIFLLMKFQNKNITASDDLNDNVIRKAQKNINPNAFKMNGKASTSHTFIPIKIIDNDNELEKIVPDYSQRKQLATEELISRLGKALPNDIIWSILQTLFLEFFLKDHKILLNTTYQRGLLLQKEKKYKDAITHYSYGLYYLMNFYNAPFNPSSHIIDFVSSEIELIEMAQQKFINKIQLCMKNDNISPLKATELTYALISRTPLSKLTFDDFLSKIEPHLKIKDKNIYEDGTIGSKQNKPINEWGNDDIMDGLIFKATLQLRTPLEVLKHHGEVFKGRGTPPAYAKEDWQGIWLPKVKTYKEIAGLDIEIPEGTVATDIGGLYPDEANLYFNYLIKFHTISESNIDAEEKIAKIKQLYENDKEFREYYIRQTGDGEEFLESYFNLLIKNVVSYKIAKSLNEAGFRTLKDLKGVDSKDLLKLEGVGKATIDKLSPYLILL